MLKSWSSTIWKQLIRVYFTLWKIAGVYLRSHGKQLNNNMPIAEGCQFYKICQKFTNSPLWLAREKRIRSGAVVLNTLLNICIRVCPNGMIRIIQYMYNKQLVIFQKFHKFYLYLIYPILPLMHSEPKLVRQSH
jgi:hypothetical protein